MPLLLTQGLARVDGLSVTFKVSSVKGIPAEIEITPDAGDPVALPDDVLAVLGWAWARLIPLRAVWGSRVRLRATGRERGHDAESKLELVAAHLARLLAEPPRQYHERLAGARWSVVFRRLMPLLAAVGLVAAAAFVAKLDLAENSPIRMLIFHAPPLVLMIFFSMNELPRVEIPPLPCASKAPSWRGAVASATRA